MVREMDMHMDNLKSRSPFGELIGDEWNNGTGMANVDFIESGNKYVVKMDVPGLTSSDLRVTIENGQVLIVSGDRKDERTTGNCLASTKASVCVRERHHGKFSRSVRLPSDIDTSDIDASVHNGILTVILGKTGAVNNTHHVAIR